MAEYIERRRLFNALADYWNIPRDWDGRIDQTCEDALGFIEDAPEADVVEVKRGEWVGLEYDGFADGCPVYDLWECSECGEEVSGEDVPDTHPYCHNCGCRMDKDGE